MARKNKTTTTKLAPDIAEKLRVAREQRSTWIWLDDSDLTEIPEENFHLMDLESIILSGSRTIRS